MTHYHKSYEVVAYTYDGSIWCTSCVNTGECTNVSKQDLTPVFLEELTDEVCDCCLTKIMETI